MTPRILVLIVGLSMAAHAQMPPPAGGPMGPPPGGRMGPPPGGGPPHAGGPGGPPPQGGGGGGGLIREFFFPPEIVMTNQKAIGLTSEQQASIRKEMQAFLAEFTDLQWQQNAEEEAMRELAKSPKPDEEKILAQLDRLTSIENSMKRAQLATMVRIKNILTPEQQEKLRKLDKSAQDKDQRGP